MKRIMALLLACVLLFICFGCKGGSKTDATTGGTTTKSSAAKDSTKPGDSSESGGVAEFTALIVKNTLTKDVTTMQWLNELQAENGVKIVDWQQYSSDWGEKKQVLFASGDVPDLLFNATDPSDFDTYSGLFEELTPLIEQYGPDIQRMFAEQPETQIRATHIDGKIYGVANYNAYQVTVHGSMFINKKWIDNLRLSVPTTWDELYNVLAAFRDGDPNGNGDPNDEIPFDFWAYGSYSALNLLGSTGIQLVGLSSGNSGYFAEDGVVKHIFVDERYKEYIKFLHKLYSEGLINPEVFTRDFAKMMTLAAGEGDVAKVGMQIFWDIPTIFPSSSIADQYIVLPQLKQSATSTDDVRYNYEPFRVFSSAQFAISMSSKCPDKAAAMRFFNAFYQPKNSAQSLYGGIVDGHLEDKGDGSYTVLPPEDPSVSGTVWMWTNTLGPIGPYYVYDGLLNNAPDTDNARKEKAVYDVTRERINFEKDFFGFMYFKMTPEDTDTIALNGPNLQVDWANWIMEGGIDEDWDAHVRRLMDSGLKQNLEIYQKYYEQYVASMK